MIVILLTLSLVMIGFGIGITHYYYNSIASTFQTHAKVIPPVWQKEVEFTKEKLKSYSDDIIDRYKYEGALLELLSRNGELIQGTTGFYEYKRFEVDDAVLKGRVIYNTERNVTSGEKVISVYIPLLYEGHVVGVLRYVTSLTKVDNLIRMLLGDGLIICVMVAFLVFFISLHLGSMFVKPIKEIILFSQTMARGQYKSRIEKSYPNELGDLARTLNTMGDEIQNTDRLKNDFISSVSHELRTPLTGIKGWLETMQDPDELSKEDFQFGLSMIQNESERLIGLVVDLLDFSRYQSERIILETAPVSIEKLLQEVIFQLQKKAEEKKINLTLSAESCTLMGDSGKLKQVILNILDNAIKFTPLGEEVTVIETIDKDSVSIIISDKGIGIHENNLKYIMESFYKCDSISTGAGLGLAIAKSIIDLHNGTLLVESEYGKGTKVLIKLPL
jgi:signal transduction histidine kinase